MFNLIEQVKNFLIHCEFSKKLNSKTIKAYSIDLKQFTAFSSKAFDKAHLSEYIVELHRKYKPKTVKRKIACLKAFSNFLIYEDIIGENPFAKIKTTFKEPLILPKIIPLEIIQRILICAYGKLEQKNTEHHKKEIIRDIAVLELLFATGARVSEICTLKISTVDLLNCSVKIYGKGSRERIIQIENPDVYKLFAFTTNNLKTTYQIGFLLTDCIIACRSSLYVL